MINKSTLTKGMMSRYKDDQSNKLMFFFHSEMSQFKQPAD